MTTDEMCSYLLNAVLPSDEDRAIADKLRSMEAKLKAADAMDHAIEYGNVADMRDAVNNYRAVGKKDTRILLGKKRAPLYRDDGKGE